MIAARLKQNAAFLLALLLFLDAGAQVLRFPRDSSLFVPATAESLFIFSRGLAVTVRGVGLDRIRYEDASIRGDGLPRTLHLTDPLGAILYSGPVTFPNIPCIRSRSGTTEPLAPLLRSGVLQFTRYGGNSGRNGVEIDVWQQRQDRRRSLLFFPEGRVMGVEEWVADADAPGVGDLAGVWIDPPEYGVGDIPAMLVHRLSRDACLVIYIDGLGWSAFEQSLLEEGNPIPADTVRMAWAAYPPVTRVNYRAMIRLPGGATIFEGLSTLGVSYAVQEGETMIFPVPGRLTLHPDTDPVAKDKAVFIDALTAAREPGLSLLWVHFHGLDDLNHRLGPADRRTKDHLLTLGGYCRRLRQAWPGEMLIVSDHGGHVGAEGAAGSQGGHGDFIFADMAVPLISLPAAGSSSGTAAFSAKQAAALLDSAPLSVAGNQILLTACPAEAELMIVFAADTLRFNAADTSLFRERFDLSYERKGSRITCRFYGRRLGELIPGLDTAGCTRITARSSDGHAAVFSAADPEFSSLVIRCSPNDRTDAGLFALYPPGDRFPSRIVKYLTSLTCE